MRYCAICGIDEKDLTTSMLNGKNEKGEAIVYCPECWTSEVGLVS